ncbi:hypothetical protein [Caldivirga sp.]|uniref:hypothetical protein n=1 Tax=Caldivirga sp. TaxID=2080243 RepID=UPI0025BD30E8|nr:hypothetical protein [Caldivirga sp.]
MVEDLFEILSHEIRRKIIVSLAKGPKSFSELYRGLYRGYRFRKLSLGFSS